ncbi:hypothetical protein, partial [Porphyromonas sp.]|uniref:hypothetical protein n=1 Tax=Porphyromonas sp. TaxID=1924944 RepID=UPI003AB41806
AFCTFTLCVEHRETLQIPLISIYLPAILSLILFPLIVPPASQKLSSIGTKEFQEGNYFWNSYILRNQYDTKSTNKYSALAMHGFRKSKMSVGVADMWRDLRSFVQEV